MPDKWPLANGNWSNAANWNGGTKPVAGDDVFADGRTVTVDESFTVATLRSTQRSGGTVGGAFQFNTAGVTGTVTSSSPLVPGATNLIQITATTGTVTLSLGGNIAPRNISNDILINYSGNCNFNITGGINITGDATLSTIICISKSSAGTLTITGNVLGATSGGGSNSNTINSTSGNTVIIGNVTGATGGNPTKTINQNAGTLTIIGNVTGGAISANNQCIFFSGTSLSVTGNALGGTVSAAIDSSAPINNITGNVTAGTVSAISSTSANTINITGTVTASASAPAITMTNANGQVYLNGNMVNNNGKMAIFAPIVWLDKNNTTSAAFFTSGGVARTLYSADTVPNTPAANNVREGVVFGAGNSLTGTIQMPVAADVRNGVVYDNGTTGTALFTTTQLLTEINASSDAVAVRIKNAATPQILGELMEAFKK
jgi:hypothetical protein